jgi:glycine/D-amino acid oxidase-like deaminating enzyme
MNHHDVAVVGLGIVGACAVYGAAQAGARVVALDAARPGDGTSGTSFAWLNANRKEPEAYHRLNADAMTAHEQLARELGGEAGFHAGGSLEWAEGGAEEQELRARVERLARRGYAAAFLPRARLAALEPALAVPDHVREVAFYAGEGWLDAPRAIRALLTAAARRGAEIHAGTPVRALRVRGDHVDALRVDGGEVPGLLAVTSPPAAPLRRVVHAPGIHLRPDAGGGLLLGSEDVDAPSAGASPSTLDDLAALLLERAKRVVPAARDVTIVDRRVGVRPMPADRHTIAGRIPGLDNTWLIATHSGVTLGPLLGRMISEDILGGARHAALAPFRPDRFAPAVH